MKMTDEEKRRRKGIYMKKYYAQNKDACTAKTKECLERRPPEYKMWVSMKERCRSAKSTSYPNYGGRGIKVCDAWKASFSQFLKDMGSRPTPEHQIDRIDNDGNYEPDNCRWATAKENNRNKPSTRMTVLKAAGAVYQHHFGQVTLAELAELYGMAISTMSGIVNGNSWSDSSEINI